MPDTLADAILFNGRILTVDPQSTVAEAVAISKDKILAVGKYADIAPLAGEKTVRIDLAGATVVPGMIDNHTHQLLAGQDAPGVGATVNISTATSIAEIKGLIAAEVKRVGPGKWIRTSCMFRGAMSENRFPNRYDLDEVAPHNPLYIFQSGKNIIANSLALEMAGITRDTEDPQDPEYSIGHIVKDDAGEPTGHLIAGGADLARRRWWKALGLPMKKWEFLYYDGATNERALKAQMAIFNACGITGTRDMGLPEDEIDVYKRLAAKGHATVRTDLIVGLPMRYVGSLDAEEMIAKYSGSPQGGWNDYWRIGGFKFVLQNDGYWSHPPEKAKRLILAANRQGWTLAIHGPAMVADDAWDNLMLVLEEANRQRPLAGRRFSFEHWVGCKSPAALQRLKDWGVSVAPNPTLSYFAAARSKKMHEVLQQLRIEKQSTLTPMARARAEWGLHIRDWLDAGLNVSGGTDCPASIYDIERPLLGMYAARTQDSLAGTLLAEQKVTPEQALRMWTINSAYAMGAEDRVGSIEVGKLADMAILSGDPLTTADEDLLKIKVLRTILGGRTVYERSGVAV